MGTEKYRLKWSKFESNILNAFQSLYETEQLSDVTLFCEGTTFKAHRLVLAACSSHFQNLFSNAPVTATHTQLFVILDGTRADDLQILLQFMYKGEAYLHEDRIDSVIRTAELLQIKGLCETEKKIVLNDNSNLRGSSTLGGGGSGAGSPASNAYMSGAHPHEPSSHHRSGPPGIMGTTRTHIRKEHREPSHIRGNSELHRDLENVRLLRQSSNLSADNHDGPGHHSSRAMSPPPDHHGFFATPTSRSGPSNESTYGGLYGRAGFSATSTSSQFLGGGGSNRDYSPSERERSPPRGRTSHGSASSAPTITSDFNRLGVKPEEYDYDHRGPGPGSRTGSLGHHPDRGTPASDKTMDRHTPASHHGGNDRHSERDYDTRVNSRNSPPSPVSTPSKFPASDSTTDQYAKAASSSTFKSERVSDSGGGGGRSGVTGGPGLNQTEAESQAEARAKFQLQDYRREPPDQTLRPRSPRSPATVRSSAEQTRITTNDEQANRTANLSLEAFRRVAQAQAELQERNRFLPETAGVLHGGINAAATIAAQGLTGTSASDLMRLAVPVRDPENGDTISGSGSKLKCPFCERTYGYETNLRAHIRQRHQGIRVSCPYCPRTFTRNNTVRRHVAREHRNMPTSRIPAKFGSTRVMPDPIRAGQLLSAVSAATAIGIANSTNYSARASGLNQGLGALTVQSPSPPDGSAGNGGIVSPIPAPSAP